MTKIIEQLKTKKLAKKIAGVTLGAFAFGATSAVPVHAEGFIRGAELSGSDTFIGTAASDYKVTISGPGAPGIILAPDNKIYGRRDNTVGTITGSITASGFKNDLATSITGLELWGGYSTKTGVKGIDNKVIWSSSAEVGNIKKITGFEASTNGGVSAEETVVDVNGAKVTGAIYGVNISGEDFPATATGTTVTLTDITGATATGATVTGAMVRSSWGTATGIGMVTATSSGTKVNITGGSLFSVLGADVNALRTATANGSEVNVTDADIKSSITGARVSSRFGQVTATGTTVKLKNVNASSVSSVIFMTTDSDAKATSTTVDIIDSTISYVTGVNFITQYKSGTATVDDTKITLNGATVHGVTGVETARGTLNANNTEIIFEGKASTVNSGVSAHDITAGTAANSVLTIKNVGNKVYSIKNFDKFNFVLPAGVKDGDVLLNITNSALYQNDFSNTEIDTTLNKDNFTPDTDITLLSAEKPITVSEDKLKINGEAKEAAIETAVDGLSGKVEATVGYDVSEKAIKLATDSYKLLENTGVTKDVTLSKELNLNDQTLNMQSDPEDAAVYNTLTVNKLSGKANLAIDVDFVNDKNDKININGTEENNATVTLTGVIVRTDLSGPDEMTENDKVSVIEGKKDGITFNVANGAVKSATVDYIYTFTQGAQLGKLNVKKEDATTISDFIQGKARFSGINFYTVNKDVTAIADLGTTKRDSDKKLTVAFNADKTLSGDNKTYTGVVVDSGYTLNLQGEDDKTPGTMTQFKTAAVTNNGALEVTNMKFDGNEKDIVNNGKLKLTGTNTVQSLTNDGQADLEGTNEIKDISGSGTFNVNDGKTTVSGVFDQKVVNVNSGTLNLTGDEKAFAEKSAVEHIVNINGGTVEKHIYGGFSKEDAHENTVNVNGGNVGNDVYGGISQGNAYKNTVNIEGGTIERDVYGGLTSNGTAYENTVNISGGLIKGDVYGGIDVEGKINAHRDNAINISGGKVEGIIFGASADVNANNVLRVAPSSNNPIEVGNIAYLQKLDFVLPKG